MTALYTYQKKLTFLKITLSEVFRYGYFNANLAYLLAGICQPPDRLRIHTSFMQINHFLWLKTHKMN